MGTDLGLVRNVALVAALVCWSTIGPAAAAPALQAPAAAEALAVIVHRSNPVDGLTLRELRQIFMLDTQTWPNGRKITVVLREKGQPERGEAIRLICGLSEAQFERHVLFQTFRGTLVSGPRSILSASAMLRFIFNAPGAIGYVPSDQVDDTTKVLRIDGMLPLDPRYPLRRRAPRPDADAHDRR
jgi:ABC-type phosphate transport system substrate-binding protein